MLPAIAAAAPYVIGAMSMFGQQQTNDANVTSAKYATDQNMADAQKNRDFQQYNSNTSHQREVADLKAAGLNPLLSGTGGAGASTGSGATGTAVAPKIENALQSGITSAIDLKNMQLAATKQGAEIESMSVDNDLKKAMAKKAGVDTKVAEKGIPESEIKNKVYKFFTPYIDKLENGLKSDAKRGKDGKIQWKQNWQDVKGKIKQHGYVTP